MAETGRSCAGNAAMANERGEAECLSSAGGKAAAASADTSSATFRVATVLNGSAPRGTSGRAA